MRHLLVAAFFLAAIPVVSFVLGGPADAPRTAARSLGALPTAAPNRHYVSNRAPLTVNPLVKLPIGAVEPRGWLLSQLQLMRDGFTGRLSEISPYLRDDSGWITLKGKGWEEMPYWLKGYGDLAYLLNDPEMRRQAERWLNCAFKSQQPDGYFGPVENKDNHDLWPNMVMLAALQSFYEATSDARVVPFMTRYFQYENRLPDSSLLPASWQKLRGGENLESVYWLYNRTGEPWLLDLGRRIFERTADWTSPILTADRDKSGVESSFYHGVNIAMGFREPAVYWQQSKDKTQLDAVERNYRQVLDAFGRQPGGMFGADENIRPGKADPRQGAETCSMVEFMASFESLLRIHGDAAWADRCEEVAFNSLPSSMTPDLKGLHYLTAPNLIACDSSGEHDFQNGGTLLSYDPWSYRCCQHNVAFGWPYFAEHLWMATADNGLAAVLYAPSTVSAVVAEDGTRVGITEETGYPFDERIDLTLSTPHPVEFPLYLRIPGWAAGARLMVNGEPDGGLFQPGRFVVLKRLWRHGDQIRLEFPAAISVTTWARPANSVSIRRGALWYSLKIGEEWKKVGGTDRWPAYEVLPTTPWNYGLIVDAAHPEKTIKVAAINSPPYQPFAADAAPIVLTAKARRVPAWQAEGRMVGLVPASPAPGEEHDVDVLLIPMGCARLRISSFPIINKSD